MKRLAINRDDIFHMEDGKPVLFVRFVWKCPKCGNQGLYYADPQTVPETSWPICWDCSGIGIMMHYTGITSLV